MTTLKKYRALYNKVYGSVLLRYAEPGNEDYVYAQAFKRFISKYLQMAFEISKGSNISKMPVIYVTDEYIQSYLYTIWHNDDFAFVNSIINKPNIILLKDNVFPKPTELAKIFIISKDTKLLQDHLFRLSNVNAEIEYYTTLNDQKK